MTRDDIIRMAREAGLTFDPRWGTCMTGNVQIERFARAAYEAGAETEREAMLDLVDDYAKGNTDLKAAIRARGEK